MCGPSSTKVPALSKVPRKARSNEKLPWPSSCPIRSTKLPTSALSTRPLNATISLLSVTVPSILAVTSLVTPSLEDHPVSGFMAVVIAGASLSGMMSIATMGKF